MRHVRIDSPFCQWIMACIHQHHCGMSSLIANNYLLGENFYVNNSLKNFTNITDNCSKCLKFRAGTMNKHFLSCTNNAGPSDQIGRLTGSLHKAQIGIVDLVGPLLLHCMGEESCFFKCWILMVHKPLSSYTDIQLVRDLSVAAVFESLIIHINARG